MNHPIVKVILYLLVLVLFEFLGRAELLTSADVKGWDWWEWLKFCAALVAPAALVMRTYLDQSYGRYLTAKNEAAKELQVP